MLFIAIYAVCWLFIFLGFKTKSTVYFVLAGLILLLKVFLPSDIFWIVSESKQQAFLVSLLTIMGVAVVTAIAYRTSQK